MGLLGGAALAATLALPSAPAGAETVAGQPINYTCTEPAMGGLSPRLPLAVDPIGQVSGEVGAVLGTLTASTGLLGLVETLDGTLSGPLSVVSSFAPTMDGAPLAASFGSDGTLSMVPAPVPSLPVGTAIPIVAPGSFTASISELNAPIATLNCTLDATSTDTLGTVVVSAESTVVGDPGGGTVSPGGPGGTVTGGTGGTATGGSSTSTGGTTTRHSRTYALSAHLAHRTIKARTHAKVLVRVTASDGPPVTGTAVVSRGRHALGSHRLSSGRATVRLKLLRPGRYRLKVAVNGLATTLTVRVRR